VLSVSYSFLARCAAMTMILSKNSHGVFGQLFDTLFDVYRCSTHDFCTIKRQR
jgi:hypothetical protein